MKNFVDVVHNLFNLNNLQFSIRKITIIGIKISIIILLFSTLLLEMYVDFQSSNTLYIVSSSILKSSSIFATFFLICGISFNKIVN